MKTRLLLCLFICFVFKTKGQGSAEFITLDHKVLTIPLTETYTTASIAGFIMDNYKTEKEKLRAIYSWVTATIKYDRDSMYVINSGRDPDARITSALVRRKGVCENYAAIFNDIALKCGIQSYEVAGYTRQYGSVDKAAHMWCAVYLESQWYLCDPTWDAGFSAFARYFLISPADFIESHMPFDPLFQFLKYPVSHKEFYNSSIVQKKDRLLFNYTDSLDAYARLNELEKLESSERRIRQAGIPNEMARNRLSFVQMQVSIINQEKNKDTYNDAVADLNNVSSLFNQFVQYRNKGFVPAKTDENIQQMLLPLDAMIATAFRKLDALDNAASNFQYDTGLLRTRINALNTRLKEQKDFLSRYFATAIPERNKLFYK